MPLLHVLVSKPRIINPLLQLYVATSIALAPKVMLTEPSCGGSNAGHSESIQFMKIYFAISKIYIQIFICEN